VKPKGREFMTDDATTRDSSIESDAELIAALRAGDEAAFERVVRLYAGRMLAVARRMLGNEEDAQDAVQEAFLSAHRAIDRFAGDSRFYTWLHRITINAALMRLRRRKARNERSIDDLLPRFREDGHRAHHGSPWRDTAENEVESEETRRLIQTRIKELPDSYRTVIVLRDIEGLSTEETAEHLGINPGAVKTRLHRARLALRELLDPHFREDAV
jgi:RNA polymerase sigma-70 factor (ECF subfamily)